VARALTFVADLIVEAGDAFHQLPLLTAAHEVDKVARQDLLQLANAQTLDVLHAAQVGQGGGPALRWRGLLRVPRRLEQGDGRGSTRSKLFSIYIYI